MERILTKRLEIQPMNCDQLAALAGTYRKTVPALCVAYEEMLCGCRLHPEAQIWYTSWKLSLLGSGEPIGYAGFHGQSRNGMVEIGYGIEEQHASKGFATEAVRALCAWALSQPGVDRVEAETEAQNLASQAVLRKVGFLPTGTLGEEGPCFVLDTRHTN